MNRLRRLFLAPTAIILATLFVAPLLIVFAYSLHARGVYGGVIAQWTLENYVRLFDPLYGGIFVRTFVIAAASTILCLVLAFPLALFIAGSGNRKSLYL
jgi:spermidine/putrescine transport system permease protein